MFNSTSIRCIRVYLHESARYSDVNHMWLCGVLVKIDDVRSTADNLKSNDSSMREGISLDARNWFERRYELHTPKSVGREGSKALALSVVPYFSLSPPYLAILTWGDFQARSRFACFTIPSEKMRDYSQSTRIAAHRHFERMQMKSSMRWLSFHDKLINLGSTYEHVCCR